MPQQASGRVVGSSIPADDWNDLSSSSSSSSSSPQSSNHTMSTAPTAESFTSRSCSGSSDFGGHSSARQHHKASFSTDSLNAALKAIGSARTAGAEPPRNDSLPVPRPPLLLHNPPQHSASAPARSCERVPQLRGPSPFAAVEPQTPIVDNSSRGFVFPPVTHTSPEAIHEAMLAPAMAMRQPLIPQPPTAPRTARAVSPSELLRMLEVDSVLPVDVRSLSSYLGSFGRIRRSININFPTLLIKRFHKGNLYNFSLSAFVTTELGKDLLNERIPDDTVDDTVKIDIVVINETLETRDPASLSPGSVLLSVLERKSIGAGAVLYLDRPLEDAVRSEPGLQSWLVTGEDIRETRQEQDSQPASRNWRSSTQANTGFRTMSAPPRLSPLPMTENASSFGTASIPSPSTPGGSRPRAPRLRRIDTSENLLGPPKGVISTHTSASSSSRSPSQRQPTLRIDASCSSGPAALSLQSICHMQSKDSPAATAVRFAEADLKPPPLASPRHFGGGTSSPDPADEPTEDEVTAPFVVSTIIPNFLYLGSEPTCPADLDKLESLGVKEVLNLALECEDKDGSIAKRFGLRKLGMRDFVEETGVQKSFEDACRILNNAQLQSRPVYCHCRAGKSRSVTIVLAYLVHRNHWSLKRAYSHVRERRPGISPNIGFVAELMKWEELERGRKSSGVFGQSHGGGGSSIPISSETKNLNLSASLPPSATAPSAIAPAAVTRVLSPPPMARASSDQGAGAGSHSDRYIKTGLASPAFFPPHARPQVCAAGPGGRERGNGDDDHHETTSTTASISSGVDDVTPFPRAEQGREIRAADGSWLAARPEEHDEWSIARRRASRAGLESVRVGEGPGE